jgi:transaldolase
LTNLLEHPLTDRGLERFLADWEDYKEARDEAPATTTA